MAGKAQTIPENQRDEGSAKERSPKALRVARTITDERFQDPTGKRGDRLMLFSPDGEDLTRWTRAGVSALISTLLGEGPARG